MKKELYLHVGNSGATFVIEKTDRTDGNLWGGPVLTLKTSAFGNLNGSIKVRMSKDGLSELIRMLQDASNELISIDYKNRLYEAYPLENYKDEKTSS